VTGDPLQTGTRIQAVKPTAINPTVARVQNGDAFCNIPQHGHPIFSKTVRLRASISGDTVSKQSVSIGAPDNDLHSART
jgi:hypothetical protein